eukprot:4080208-Prymnesium_polylepis.2
MHGGERRVRAAGTCADDPPPLAATRCAAPPSDHLDGGRRLHDLLANLFGLAAVEHNAPEPRRLPRGPAAQRAGGQSGALSSRARRRPAAFASTPVPRHLRALRCRGICVHSGAAAFALSPARFEPRRRQRTAYGQATAAGSSGGRASQAATRCERAAAATRAARSRAPATRRRCSHRCPTTRRHSRRPFLATRRRSARRRDPNLHGAA